MARVIKNVLVLGAAAFFAVMWGLLLRERIEQQRAAELTLDYSRLLPPGQDHWEREMGIYFMRTRLGKTHTSVQRTQQGSMQIRSETEVELGSKMEHIIGVSGRVNIDFNAYIEPLSGLRNFSLSCQELSVSLRGIRRGRELVLVGSFRDHKIRTDMSFEQGRFVTGAFSPLGGLPELDRDAVGKTWQFHIVNPVLGRVEKVKAQVESSQLVKLDSKLVRVFRISVSTPVSRWESWVSKDGEILIQGTPYGLTLMREDIQPSVLQGIMRPAPGSSAGRAAKDAGTATR